MLQGIEKALSFSFHQWLNIFQVAYSSAGNSEKIINNFLLNYQQVYSNKSIPRITDTKCDSQMVLSVLLEVYLCPFPAFHQHTICYKQTRLYLRNCRQKMDMHQKFMVKASPSTMQPLPMLLMFQPSERNGHVATTLKFL